MDVDATDLLDPCPSIHDLFVHYNATYFQDKLGACSVEWSSGRMTLCAGTCALERGGGVRIKLSEPILKLRPTRDLKETLLHEMIHAENFLEGITRDGPDGHGPKFLARMRAINEASCPDPLRPAGGYQVSPYHEMHAEVDNYRTHHWQCDRCGHVIKRAMNRPPQEADCSRRMGRGDACRDPSCRYHTHIRTCGGQWVKTKEPEKAAGSKEQAGKRGRSGQGAAAASSSGGGGGGAAGEAVGTSQAAGKRPRPGGVQHGGAPAPANPPITRWFTPDGAGARKAPAHGSAGGAAAAGSAETGAAPAAALTAEQLRRQCAEAALRRLQQQPGEEGQPLAMVAASGSSGQHEAGGGGSAHGGPSSSGSPLPHDMPPGGQSGPSAPPTVACPVCCQEWQAGSISNADLNAHLDECLTLLSLRP